MELPGGRDGVIFVAVTAATELEGARALRVRRLDSFY